MSIRKLKPQHHEMLDSDFSQFNPWDGRDRIIYVTLKCKPPTNKLSPIGCFYFVVKYENFETKINGIPVDDIPQQDELTFSLYEDCTVVVGIDEDFMQWTKGIIQLTTKEEFKAYYRSYREDNKVVIFKAKTKSIDSDEESKSHLFSLNFNLKQDNGKWIPISLDPVIINPRPGSKDFDTDKGVWLAALSDLKIPFE